MKQSIIIITLCLFSFASLQDLQLIIISADETEVGTTTTAIRLGCIGLLPGDVISLTNSNTLIGPPQDLTTIPVSTGATCPFSAQHTIAVGVYNIFITRNSISQRQTPRQYVANKISANSLTAIDGKPLVNVPIEIKLTFASQTILKSDTISLTTATSEKLVTMKTHDFDSGVVTINAITFTEEETYQVLLERKGNRMLQSGANLKVVVVRPKTSDIFNTPSPLYATGQPQTVKLSFTAGVVVNDIISITSKETVDSSAITTTISAAQSPVSTTEHAYTAGLYNIFITSKEAGSLPVKQNAKLVVFAKTINDEIISAITGTDVKANKAATIKFTYPKNTLYNGDKIILSLSTGNTVSDTADDNLALELSNVDFEKAELTQSVTFKKEGTYSVWIKRGTDASVKQTGAAVNIIVAVGEDNSNWISISLVILIGVLIF